MTNVSEQFSDSSVPFDLESLKREGWQVVSSPITIPNEDYKTLADLEALGHSWYPEQQTRVVPEKEGSTDTFIVLLKPRIETPQPEVQGEIPPGDYSVIVHFDDLKKIPRNVEAGSIFVPTSGMSTEDLERNARSWISMVGLHNFGLRTSSSQEVRYDVVNKETKEIFYSSSTKVNSSGHIIS